VLTDHGAKNVQMQAGEKFGPECRNSKVDGSGSLAPGDGALQGRAAAATHGSAIFVAHAA
jgi:hypothetical protein